MRLKDFGIQRRMADILFQKGEQIYPIFFEDDASEYIQANHSAEVLSSSFGVR